LHRTPVLGALGYDEEEEDDEDEDDGSDRK
jgi:hypothetical protein